MEFLSREWPRLFEFREEDNHLLAENDPCNERLRRCHLDAGLFHSVREIPSRQSSGF